MCANEHKYLFFIFLYTSPCSVTKLKPARSEEFIAHKLEPMKHTAKVPVKNHLISRLSSPALRRLSPYLESVSLDFGQELFAPGDRIRNVYFPHDSVISLLSVVKPKKATEVAVVGNEGVVGGSAALGINDSYLRAVVQVSGMATRITATRMRSEFGTHDSWHPELLQFTNALMNQVAQTAVCNRFHKVDERLARWLLAIRDRVQTDHFHLTQEFLSLMLGVRRVAVTIAATDLQKRGLIVYSRGNIQLLHPAGLERVSCECYGLVKEMYRRCNKKR
jgi:CRP-like cAMP-binding protein